MMKTIQLQRDEVERGVSQFLSDMIKIPSTSGNEGGVIDRIATEMKAVGFDAVRVDPFGNVIGQLGSGPRIIAFDAHVDTVDVGNRSLWEFDPFSGHIRDGFVWGRGTSDQEGGMASMVYAGYLMKKYNLVGPEFTILMTGTVSEEDCDGLCWRYLVEKENIRPELVVVTEPTDCRLYRGQRGRMEITATMPGISSHGSAPERGDNAIIKMAEVIRKVPELAKRLATDEFLGKGSITISQATSTAPSLCSVADSCQIYFDRRLTWGETPQGAVEEIRALGPTGQLKVEVPEYTTPTHTGLVYPVVKEFPAWKTPENHPSVQAGIKTYSELFGRPVEVGRWTFSTNGVAISGVHKIPCIGFGPGREEWAHAPNERIAVEQLTMAAVFYAHFPAYYLKAING